MEHEYTTKDYQSRNKRYTEGYNLCKRPVQYKQNYRNGPDFDVVGTICEPICEPGLREHLSRFFYESCWNDTCKAFVRQMNRNFECSKCKKITLRPKLRFKVNLTILSGSNTYEVTSFQSTSFILNHSESFYLQYPNPSDLVLSHLQFLSNKKFLFTLSPYSKGLIIQSCIEY